MDVAPIPTRRLELISLSPDAIESLFAGDHAAAEEEMGLSIPRDWPEPGDERWLTIRLGQMRSDPGFQLWAVRLMALRVSARVMVGHVGFHGPPDLRRAVEMGYTVLPSYRRRGYATEAVRGLMDWAVRDQGIRRFRLSISPTNVASLALASRLRFRYVGEHVDERNGLEHEFELAISDRRSG